MFSQLQYLSQHTSINKYYGSIKVRTFYRGLLKDLIPGKTFKNHSDTSAEARVARGSDGKP